MKVGTEDERRGVDVEALTVQSSRRGTNVRSMPISHGIAHDSEPDLNGSPLAGTRKIASFSWADGSQGKP
jgi:hypothetical protein